MAHSLRLSTQLRPWVLVVSTLFGAVPVAHAGLFEDDEARRAILELRQQRAQDVEAQNARIAALTTQIDQLKRSLLDLNAQVEQLRTEVARQRGNDEVLARDLAEVQRRLQDTQTSVDQRVRQLEPQTITLDGKTFKVEPDEKRDFDEALGRLRGADFAGGVAGLKGLLQRNPNTGYKESIRYWLGNAHYGLREYKEAIASFKLLVDQTPDHSRAPEALLSIANCQIELKEGEAARKTLEQVIKQYPQSEAAAAARDRLLTMPSSAAKPRRSAK